MQQAPLWLITGASSGLGQALAGAALESGAEVIATFRQEAQALSFTQQHPGRGSGFVLDVTDAAGVARLADWVAQTWGRLDVLVNNAGFGFAGAVEEASAEEVRAVFETNFFAVHHLTQAFLPLMRKQRSGWVVQISSQAGFRATPGFGIYNASKFALEGMSEALAGELAPLGIRLTIVEPGPFRTRFASASLMQAAQRIADYEGSAGAFRARMQQIDGKQEGDPAKAARLIVSLAADPNPPLRLPLGRIALASLAAKLDSVRQDLERCRPLAESAVFED
jgi:NAD(P)-dependent dehydrogenase (short-subunit alcohol dehydrogenase family)